MSKKLKGIIYSVLSVCLILLIVLWFYDPKFEHIEDKNGIDNYSLNTITDSNIIKLNCGPLYETDNEYIIDDSKISLIKFSGVMEIHGEDYNNESLQIDLKNLKITEGNLQTVLLVDNKIIHKFNSNESNQSFKVDNISGYVALRIAGESANFEMEYYISKVSDTFSDGKKLK